MSRSPCRPTRGSTALAALLLATSLASAECAVAVANPIGRVARVLNGRLLEVDSRIDFLRKRALSLADFRACPLQVGLGFQASRGNQGEGDPWVVLDLGHPAQIDRIYLVPVQQGARRGSSLFPRRFMIETADDPNFAVTSVVFRQLGSPFPDPGVHPVSIAIRGNEARYLRLTVVEGNDTGPCQSFALSELLVMEGSEPVSIGAKVTASSQLQVPGLWDARYLTDGRMPLGQWHAGASSPNPGLTLEPPAGRANEPLEILIDLGQTHPIDRIHLMPVECSCLPGLGAMPEAFALSAGSAEDQSDFVPLYQHHPPGDFPLSELTPLTIAPPAPVPARYLRILATKPWQYGNYSLYGFAEIQAYSRGTNVALGHPVHLRLGTESLNQPGSQLVDGFTSQHKALPLHSWLNQLAERERVEFELSNLLPLRNSLAGDSELHASWAVATVIGLSFLIPVAIIERRRLISREQVDILRKRIASDLHDDIGSNLGSISMIARSAKRDLKSVKHSTQLENDLEEVEAIARESSLALRDIVWLIERRADTIGDLVKRLRDTAARLMRELECHIDCTTSSTTARLSLDAKRHLFLFCKEAMHNVVKHAQAKSCEIILSDVRDALLVEVKDDGIGLDVEQLRHRTIFHKLEERARVLGGTVDVESAPGKGTVLRLRVARSGLLAKIPI